MIFSLKRLKNTTYTYTKEVSAKCIFFKVCYKKNGCGIFLKSFSETIGEILISSCFLVLSSQIMKRNTFRVATCDFSIEIHQLKRHGFA